MLLASKHPELTDQLRVGRLKGLRAPRRLLVRAGSHKAINRLATLALLRSIGALEALGSEGSMRFYGIWTAGLFWLGALGAESEQARSQSPGA